MEFIGKPRDQRLGIIMPIKVLSGGVLAGPSVVSADDKMSRTVVLADDCMPDGFSWASHTHSQRQECQVTHPVGVLGHDSLVDSNSRIVVDVTGFCQPDDGVDENVGLAFARSSDSQFPMCTMHRIPSLESDDLTPSELVEMSAKFGGGI